MRNRSADESFARGRGAGRLGSSQVTEETLLYPELPLFLKGCRHAFSWGHVACASVATQSMTLARSEITHIEYKP
jgi:hypothetical protein